MAPGTENGAEPALNTARFWACRAEWNARLDRSDYLAIVQPFGPADLLDGAESLLRASGLIERLVG
jgi:hypothetical protein